MSINVKNIKTDKNNFYYLWLQFLKPYHKLTNKEIELLALFLKKREELSRNINDNNLIDKMLFNKDTKADIRAIMNYETYQVFNNMMTSLRKKGAIVDNSINKGLIPKLEGNNFKLIFNFNINES